MDSLPLQKGQGSDRGKSVVTRGGCGLALRSVEMMTQRSTTGSFLNSGIGGDKGSIRAVTALRLCRDR